jgi:hypothetical protein
MTMTHQTQHPLPIAEIATRAVAAHRALRTVVQDQRAALSQTDRDAMDAALGALAEDGLFDGDALSVAEETGARLDDAIARAGGAPETRWTEEGLGDLVGGTEQGYRIACILQNLRGFLHLAWQVVDHLEAEDQLARQARGETDTSR